jgi:hypothetical protein
VMGDSGSLSSPSHWTPTIGIWDALHRQLLLLSTCCCGVDDVGSNENDGSVGYDISIIWMGRPRQCQHLLPPSRCRLGESSEVIRRAGYLQVTAMEGDAPVWIPLF